MAWKRDRSENRKRGNFGDRNDDFGGGAFEPRGPSIPRADFGSRTPVVDQTNVTATVKWFNAVKGFGFVSPSNGGTDAFLHVSALERAGHHDVPEGATVVCDLGPGQRGPQVVSVISLDLSTATPKSAGGGGAGGSGGGSRRESAQITGEPVDGTVKFFSPDKGFGFIAVDDGGKDVFVHVKTLERSGLRALEPEQRVRMTISMGQKGPQAESIALI